MADIAEQICLAVDQIVTERLKGINYDTTIVATIVDNKYAEQNRYTCSNGSAQFVAFSKDTSYKINDSVQVTIPNNDYDQQKVIIGRYVAENDLPFTYVQPFNTIIDVSSNLVDSTDGNIFSLLANEDYDTAKQDENGKYEIFPTEIPLWSATFEESYSDFTRLGIQGQFRSWISNLNPIAGDYGYRLEILSNNGTTVETKNDLDTLTQWSILYNKILKKEDYDHKGVFDNTPDKWYEDVKDTFDLTADKNGSFKQSFITTFEIKEEFGEERTKMLYSMLYVHGQITDVVLTTQDMYGDPYNYQSFYTQECVFDISSYKNIMAMSLFFYQKSGSFYSKGEVYMPYTSGINMKLVDNLFTKDPYVCLGYDLSEFDSEQAILYTLNSDTYVTKDGLDAKESQKTIRLRWLHQYENGEIKVINEDSELIDYEIRWYRFFMGAPSPDEYAGVYWKRLSVQNEDNESEAYISKTSPFTCILNPAINVAQEQIKAIVLYEGNIIRSNIITFYNEKDVASQATAELLAGLSIWCEDSSYGNYFIYGQNNNLFDESKANEVLTVKAKFADNSIITDATKDVDIAAEAPDLTEAKTIIWEFPLRNTMIVVHGFNYSFTVPEAAQIKDDQGRVIRTDWAKVAELDPDGDLFKLPGYFTEEKDAQIRVVGNNILIKRDWYPGKDADGKELMMINNAQEYRVGKTYNATSINNTVKCTISKDSLNYSATKEMSFGLMGTNGTDASLVIDFDDNKTALTAILAKDNQGKPMADTLRITAHLYDFNHKEVDFNQLGDDGKPMFQCEWKWYAYHEFSEEQELKFYIDLLIQEGKIGPECATDRKKFQEQEGLLPTDERRAYRIQSIADKATVHLVPPSENEAPNKCSIYHDVDLDINDNENHNYFLIIQATVKGFGDYDLTAYKPIPIRLNHQYRNIIGPTEIIYDSSGNVDYYKEPYELWWVEDPSNVNFVLDAVGSQEDIVLKDNRFIQWKIYNPYEESASLIGTMASEAADGGKIEEKKNILKPAPIYTKDTEPYGVECRLVGGDTVLQRYWIQPIMIMSNRYPSSTLNKWGGDEVQLDEGSIVAPAIAAGKKNSDNTFSGVMLGDWSKKDTASEIAGQTGIYGFHHGMQTYAFKEDGTAFIGKSGRGRIYFDGNTGVIRSANWDLKEDGMYLDLDDGILKMQRNSEYNTKILTEDTYEYNRYYTLETIAQKVDYGKAFDKNLTYYIETLVPVGYISEEDFKLHQTELWVKEATTYTKCTATEAYNQNTVYYVQDYGQVKVTSEEFKANKSLYYIRETTTNEDGSTTVTYKQAPDEYDGETPYYKIVYVRASPQPKEEDFKKDPTKFYKKNPDKYIQVKNTDTYNASYSYYEWGYEAQSYSVSGPPSGWNTTSDPALKNPITGKVGNYWIMTEEYVIDTEGFDPYKVYYEKNLAESARFITLSAAEAIFPLAIGSTSDEASRNFKVDWDGTAYINDGIFKGNVTADYLFCEAGVIGGWTIDQYTLSGTGIVLNSWDGSITGGILRSPGGGILLDGFFSVADGNGNEVDGTYIGFMQSNTGNTDIDYDTQGVGMRINSGSVASQIKATSYNAGLSYYNAGGGYISISSSGMSFGVSGPSTAIRFQGDGELRCLIPAEKQHGIYARFA